MVNKTSQTATEYLIILGVVITIAVITVSSLSEVLDLGGGMDERTAQLILASQTVAITDFAVSDYDTDLLIQNNHNERIEIDSISLNGEECLFFYGTKHIFRPGEKKTIVCQNVYEIDDDKVSWLVEINWTDLNTGASYTQNGRDLALVGAVANEYLSVVQSNEYWNGVDGCYDTGENPIPICTCIDLNKTRDNLATDHTMQNSIDFIRCNEEFGVDFVTGSGWEPIATGANPWDGGASSYTGDFDGNLKNIKSLRSGPLFYATYGGLIKNLGLTDTQSPLLSQSNYGADIENVYVQGDVQGAGAIIEFSTSFIGTLTNVIFKGSVTGSGSYTGGLVGSTDGDADLRITNALVEATVSGNQRTGGVVGASFVPFYPNNVNFYGSVNGNDDVGGLLGFDGGVGFRGTNLDVRADVQGHADVGGLVGQASQVEILIDGVSFSGTVNGSDYVGGFYGRGTGSSLLHRFTNSRSTAQIYATGSNVGGLFGNLYSPSIIADYTGFFIWTNYSDDNATQCVGSGTAAPDLGGFCTIQ